MSPAPHDRGALGPAEPRSPANPAVWTQGLLAGDAEFPGFSDQAIRQHAQTLDAFEAARTRLAYGERLRRARNRVLAREQLRAAQPARRMACPAGHPVQG